MHIPKPVVSPHPVQLQLDTPQATFIPGAPITGRLTLTGAQPDQGELLVEVHAFTRGRDGQLGFSVLTSQSLYNGPFQPGVSGTFPFSISAPRCISRYQSQLFNLETRLAAVTVLASQRDANRGARRDPATWTPISIAYETTPLSIAPMAAQLTASPEGGYGGCGGFGCASMGMAGLGALGLYVAVNGLGDVHWLVIAGVLSLCTFGVGLAYLYSWRKHAAIYRRVGVAHLSVGPAPDGQSVAIDVQLERSAGITGARAVIRVEERTRTLISEVSAQQRHSSAFHTLAQLPVELVPQPGAQKLVGVLPLSALASLPPSFGTDYAEVAWRLDLDVPLRGCPNITNIQVLEAGPGGRLLQT